MIDDDELARRLAAIDPARTPRDAPLTAEQLRIRDRIMASVPVTTRERPRRWPLLLAPLAAAALVALIVVWSLASPIVPAPTAAALTPPQLSFIDDGRSIAQVVDDAQRVLTHPGSDQQAQRASTTTGWYFQIENVGSADQTAVISPQTSVFDWSADQSGSMTVYAGNPYWADLSDAPLPDDLPAAGTVLWTMQYGLGEAQQPDVESPADAPEGVLGLLRAYGMTDPRDGYDLLHTIESVQQSWTLTDTQHALLLDLVRDASGIDVLGAGRDRADRAVTAISAEMPGGASHLHVFVSADTGRIVGTEVYTTATTSAFPADAIISYSMWDLPR